MKLAINGGSPVRNKLFPAYSTIGKEEKSAVEKVLDSGKLSQYIGGWGDKFNGGPQVQALESEWSEYFGVKHAIAVNSCTSGLYCAVGAVGIEPGEEVIVSPYTMSASAVAPLIYNAIPVFADVEEEYFCLDPDSVERRITSRTRAIIIVDIFGQPYNVEKINAIAKKYNISVIEDAAQAPGACYKNRYAGTLGDVGVYSLNYHKHIHCGEGGVVVTNDDALAERVRLIRNHAEAVVENKGCADIANMIGYNFRMTEIEAAISRCQLKKLRTLLDKRQENCAYLNEKLAEIPAISVPAVRQNCEHSYYVQPFKFDEAIAGISRDCFVEAVKAELMPTELREDEGVKISCGYVKPLYLLPLFQRKIAYGNKGFPFAELEFSDNISYNKGLCPVAERMYEKELFISELMHSFMSKSDMDDVVKAFMKVWENRTEIKKSMCFFSKSTIQKL
ncbi:MAG: DegT/DnrJ/EryC1/StrS family aminotransferase [Anaerohalosphaeraceae bacterium]|nr:DegT/DnrJ/EryC1/StrS family aminotransferase [Anaerohalosphaeraceae bacterium]